MEFQKGQSKETTFRSINTLIDSSKYSGIRVMPPYAEGKQNGSGFTGSTAALAQQKSAAPKKSLQNDVPAPMPAAGKLVNALGVVAPEANLRPAPSTANQPLKLLPFNTKVQIVKDMGDGWYYVSTEQGDTGYVASRLIKGNLPEPGAILHRVASGESAIGIAERYFKSEAAQWGQDLRFYVNTLVYVNQGAGDANKGIYKAHADDSWADTKVSSGYYIWIPSRPFAKALKGVVSSGSLSYGMKEGIDQTINFFGQKLADFNYANQFVAQRLPAKLSDDILESIKAALINFAIGMVATGLILALAAGLGALIGALVGFFAGGAGAVPGAALGAKIGLEIGLFLLKWIGLGMLIVHGAKLLGGIGIAFGKYVISVWEAGGDRQKLEQCADLCAEAVKEFLLGVLELVIMLVAALGLGRAMSALGKTKFGKALGYEKLTEWVGRRSRYEGTKETIKELGSEKNKWIDKAGNIKWPPNRGFAGKPKKIILNPGTRVDRYGYEGGTFVSPEGTPYPNRALAPGTDKKPYNIYEVVKSVEVEAGEIAPWFDQPGKGIQYEFDKSIAELVKAGILKRVGP